MSESPQHLRLVEKIRDTIRERDGVTPILVSAEDHQENTITFSTPEGFRPDVYYCDNEYLILGEAKTSGDLSNWHSDAQFDSYFKYLQAAAKDSLKTILYVGVPWADFIWAKNHFKKLKPVTVGVVIVNDFGHKEEVK